MADKKDTEGQLSLFEAEDTDVLTVVRMEGASVEHRSVRWLFSGFETLRAVTYSFDLGFIEEICGNFERAQILIGSPATVRADAVAFLLASQDAAVTEVKRHKELMRRIAEGTVEIRAARRSVSHEKTYILTSDDGRSRVISGSANASFRGWAGDGVQAEDRFYVDNSPQMLEYAMDAFDALYEQTDDIPESSLVGDVVRFEDLPVVKGVMEHGAVFIVTDGAGREETEYMTDVASLGERYAGLTGGVEAPRRKDKKIPFTPEYVHELKRADVNGREAEKEERREHPKLRVDLEAGTAEFNGSPMELDGIPEDDIRRDAEAVAGYFDGYRSFLGDADSAARMYWKAMNIAFLSPFLGVLADAAYRTGFSRTYFPYFVILSGKKSAGKTEFVQFMQKLMTGSVLRPAESNTWTKRKIDESLEAVEGVPVLCDEVGHTQFNNNAGQIVKEDGRIYTEGKTRHGTYFLTTNDVQQVAQDIAKRVYFAKIPVTMDDVSAADGRKRLTESCGRAGTALYRRYLSEMIPRVTGMLEKMEAHDEARDGFWRPDIFEASSRVLIGLMEEYASAVPECFAPLTYESYFKAKETEEEAREDLRLLLARGDAVKKIDRENDRLTLACADKFDAAKLEKMLPENLMARYLGPDLTVALSEAERFAGVTAGRGARVFRPMRRA